MKATKKNDHLLTDEQIMYPADGGPPLGPLAVRDHYEGLIADGSIRVMRHVDGLPEWIDGCQYWKCPCCDGSIDPEVEAYCPGCGVGLNMP